MIEHNALQERTSQEAVALLMDSGRGNSGVTRTMGTAELPTLRDLITALFERKWLFISLFLTIAAIATVITLLLPNQYESRLKILVKNTRADVVVTPQETASIQNNSNEVTESLINSEIELLNGRDILEQIVKGGVMQPKDSAPAKDVPIEKSIRQLEKDLEITPVKKANIIEVTYVAKTPEASAGVLRQLASLYLDKHLRMHRPPGTYEFFQNEASQYGDNLKNAEGKLSSFQKQNDIVSIDQQKTLNLQKFAEVQGRLHDADIAYEAATKRIEDISKQLQAMPARIVTQTRALPNQTSSEQLNTILVGLQNRRTELLTKYRPTERLVKEVDQQIKDTSEALDKVTKSTADEQTSDVNPLRQNLEADLSKTKLEQAAQQILRTNLTTEVQQYQGHLSKIEGATVEHAALSREVKVAEDNYELYAKKREEARIADALDAQKISDVSIAEMPTVPQLPTKPNRPLTLLLGLLFALFVSFGTIFMSELLRKTFRTPRELETISGFPVLVTIGQQKTLPEETKIRATDEGDQLGRLNPVLDSRA